MNRFGKKLFLRFLLTFLLLAVVGRQDSPAQSDVKIEGKVLDGSDRHALFGVNVTVPGTAVGAVTDRNGRFVLHNLLAGEYVVEASLLGYRSQQLRNVLVSHDQPQQLVIELQPVLIELPGMEISAGVDKPSQGADIVIDQERIRHSQAGDVAELLTATCGVEIQENGASKSISIRGSQAGQVLVLVDGVRLQNGLSGAIDLSSLPLAAIEQIKVYKGPQSSRFGANALAGVVQIITRQARENQLSAELRTASFAAADAAATLVRKSGYGDILLTIEQHRSRNDYRYEYDLAGRRISEARLNADVLQRQLFGRWNREKNGSRWSFSAQHLFGHRGLPGAVYNWTPFARSATRRSLAVLSFEKKQRRRTLNVRASFNEDLTSFKNIYENVPVRYRSTPRYWNENKVTAGRLQSDLVHQISPNHQIELGVEAGATRFSDRDRLYPSLTPVGLADVHNTGVYVRHGYETGLGWNARLETQAGLRYDAAETAHNQDQRLDQAFSPSLGVSLRKQLLLDWRLQADWGHGFRLPTFADLFYQQYRVRGNAGLRPERSENFEWAIEGLWRNSLFRFNQFHHQLRDLIIWRLGSFATFSPVNTDARLSGEEIEWRWHLNRRRLETQVSYSHLRSENLSEERTTRHKQLPYRPEHSLKAGLQWAWRDLQVNYGFRRSGERFVTEANTVRLPGFSLHEITLQYAFRLIGRPQTFMLSCLNITDIHYQVLENAPLPGREWRAGWNAAF